MIPFNEHEISLLDQQFFICKFSNKDLLEKKANMTVMDTLYVIHTVLHNEDTTRNSFLSMYNS